MIEYLEKLIQDESYQKALTYAEQLIASQDLTPHDFLAIQCSLLTARYYLGQHDAAISIGHLALSAAKDLGEWDYYAKACMDMGATYYCQKRFNDAISFWYEVLGNLHRCSRSAEQEALAWYNIATVQTAKGEVTEAISALDHAMDAANRLGDHRQAHGFRHALIEACMRSGELDRIPPLLAKCLHYLRNNLEVARRYDSLLWHYKLRAEFALVTGRCRRALLVALKGLDMAVDSPVHQYYFHMLLAQCGEQEGRPEVTLGHLLSAGICAASCHRSDLESIAGNRVYELLQKHGDLMQRMDRYYTVRDPGALEGAE